MKADLDTLHCIAILRGGKHAVVTHSSDFNQYVLHSNISCLGRLQHKVNYLNGKTNLEMQ